MDVLKLHVYAALILFAGSQMAWAQNAENGARLSRRWCSECHAIGSPTDRSRGIPSFAAIAARETVTADMIASFLLLPHATMPTPPLRRSDAEDIARFIIDMKK